MGGGGLGLRLTVCVKGAPVASQWGSESVQEVKIKSRECRKALTTSQRLQISFVEIGDEHIFKLKMQKGA